MLGLKLIHVSERGPCNEQDKAEHFVVDHIAKYIFLKNSKCVMIYISFNSYCALVQAVTQCQTGDKPLLMFTYYCQC